MSVRIPWPRWVEGRLPLDGVVAPNVSSAAAVAAENGNLKPLYQFYKNAKMGLPCRSSCQLELLRPLRKRWPLCGGIILPRISTTVSERFPLRIWNSLQEIRTQVQNCDAGEGTLVTPAVEKTQQDEAACDPVAQVEPKAIGVDSIPPEACVWLVNLTGVSLRKLQNKWSVAINFLMRGKGKSCVVSQESQQSLEPSSSHAESLSPLQTAP